MIFTAAFWRTATENMLLAGLTAFTGSLAVTTTPTLKGLAAGGIAAGMGVLYALIKQLGGAQSATAVPKVGK